MVFSHKKQSVRLPHSAQRKGHRTLPYGSLAAPLVRRMPRVWPPGTASAGHLCLIAVPSVAGGRPVGSLSPARLPYIAVR